MSAPVNTTINVPSGVTTIYGGRAAPGVSALQLSVPASGTVGQTYTGTVSNPSAFSASWSLASTPGASMSPSSGVLAGGASVSFSFIPAAAVSHSFVLTNVGGGTVSGSPATHIASAASGGYFASVTPGVNDGNGPPSTAGQTLVVELHGSGTAWPFQGQRYEAALAGGLEYLTDTTFSFAISVMSPQMGFPVAVVRPWDRQGAYPNASRRESYWLGWTDGPDAGALRLYTERRLDAMMAHIDATMPHFSTTRRCLAGGSMGAWGTMSYGLRRPNKFAALYPSRPRWRSSAVAGQVTIPSWTNAVTPSYAFASAPPLVAADGGGSSATHLDHIAYVANTANEIPFIAWCTGRNDGYKPFQDDIDAVAALRAAGRGFMFYWNDGNHSAGARELFELFPVHPVGTFELGKGYPVFSEHSLDENPAVDLVGGINLGLQFRNVVESAGAWSCEVRQISTTFRVGAACTVKVKPKSSIYLGNPAPQLVTIPAANTWVTVSF